MNEFMAKNNYLSIYEGLKTLYQKNIDTFNNRIEFSKSIIII